MQSDKKELYQSCSFTILMKTDLEQFFLFHVKSQANEKFQETSLF